MIFVVPSTQDIATVQQKQFTRRMLLRLPVILSVSHPGKNPALTHTYDNLCVGTNHAMISAPVGLSLASRLVLETIPGFFLRHHRSSTSVLDLQQVSNLYVHIQGCDN